jgi:uncharacterized membrane protein
MRKTYLIILLALGLLVLAGCGNKATGNAVLEEEFVRIPLSELSKTVNFYELDDNGVKISYFVVLGSDGKPRTAFDACDVCGGYKGYEQQGNDIACRNCGRVFSIDGLGTKNKGYGCWPSYLPHEVIGDELLIKTSDLRAGSYRFA